MRTRKTKIPQGPLLTDDLIRAVREDYRFDGSVFNDEPRELREAKRCLALLEDADRRILLLFAELGTYERLGSVLGISKASAWSEVNRIRGLLFSSMRNDWENDD